MTFLEVKALIFEAYLAYLETEDPLEKAKLEVDINELISLTEKNFTEENIESKQAHENLIRLFNAYDNYLHASDPLEQAKFELELRNIMKHIEKKGIME